MGIISSERRTCTVWWGGEEWSEGFGEGFEDFLRYFSGFPALWSLGLILEEKGGSAQVSHSKSEEEVGVFFLVFLIFQNLRVCIGIRHVARCLRNLELFRAGGIQDETMAMKNQLLHTEHRDGDGNDVHACWACEMMFSCTLRRCRWWWWWYSCLAFEPDGYVCGLLNKRDLSGGRAGWSLLQWQTVRKK